MTKIMDQVDICRFNLTYVDLFADGKTEIIDLSDYFHWFYRFNVDPVMAPTSHLLVYYSTEKGEIINDVISFNVKQTDPKVYIIAI